MKSFRRIISLILIVLTVLQLGIMDIAYAATYPIQPPLENLQVSALHNTAPDDVQPPIGYSSTDGGSTGYYADFSWDALKDPTGISPSGKYMNFYLQEVAKAYKATKPTIVKERDVSGSTTALRMKSLSSGTIYYLNAKAYYTYTEGTTTYTSAESVFCNTVKFMTDIEINAYSYGTNQVKIEWDDVWNTGGRIDYKLYVSENSTFANTLPIYIGSSEISANGPVTVNEATGKLEYIHTVSDPGRVYYVKIVPDVSETGLIKTAETVTVPVSSYILVKTTKMSTNDTGTIWRLDWSPVVTGLTSSDIVVTYQIDKYVNNVPIPMLIEDGTTTFITVPLGDESYYYIIRANVTKDGVALYPDSIKIVSDKIVVKDQEVPSTPSTPELVSAIYDGYDVPIISYEDMYYGDDLDILKEGELTSTSVTVLWRAPKKADGTIDTDVGYDIWLISDPNLIDEPTTNSKIATNFLPSDANYVLDGSDIAGYKYTVSNLTANSTYYFKIMARKDFLEYVDDTLQSVDYYSQAALKVIITPAEGAIDQPLVPGKPPIRIKKDTDGVEVISETEATIQLKDRWYEEYTSDKEWVYVKVDRDASTDIVDYDPIAVPPDNLTYRKVEYDSGVTIDVGLAKYTAGMTSDDILTLPTNKVTSFPVTANDPDEDATLNSPESIDPYVYKKHNIDIQLTDLEPNTTYIIWVRATRQSVDLTSGPSDPIIITTDPDLSDQLEKPIVPTVNYYKSGDTYVDLGWDFKPNYNYYIKYGKEDTITTATGSLSTSTAEIFTSGLSYYRIEGLDPDNLYYFWIQAEAVSGTLTSKSDWSDSILMKTLPETPPDTPKGFGVKNTTGSLTKNSITYEWIQVSGLEYIIEVAGDVAYTNATKYSVGSVGEYKVEALRSNYRYYARLYAYDPTKELQSEPTQSITVRTLTSSDDYDSDQDTENVISGDFIVKDTSAVNGTWSIKIINVNADRFVEHIKNDSVLDYSIDASSPPTKTVKISILISGKVFEAMDTLKENLIINTGATQIIIRPGMLTLEPVITPAKLHTDTNYELTVHLSGINNAAAADNMKFKTGITGLEITSYDLSISKSITTLNKPLKMIVPFTGIDWYKQGVTSAYVYDSEKVLWEKAASTKTFDMDNNNGSISFETLKLGDMVIADIGSDYFEDIYGNQYEAAISNVVSVHAIKSITNRKFEPSKLITFGDAVKFMLDMLDYNYKNSDYMIVAARAGLIKTQNASNPASYCTREAVVVMVVTVYRIKTKEDIGTSTSNTTQYLDLDTVSSENMPKLVFAIDNGIAEGVSEDTFEPGKNLTRSEVMGMLEKMLALAGEIE